MNETTVAIRQPRSMESNRHWVKLDLVSKRGFLDSVEGNVVRGWAVDDSSREPVRVDISIDGRIIGTIVCSEFRADLVNAQIGDGRHAFSYCIPREYVSRQGVLTVSFTGGGPLLTKGEREYKPDLAHALFVSSVLARGAWRIREICFQDDSVLIEGWAIPPIGLAVPVGVTYNGGIMKDISWFPSDQISGMPGFANDKTPFGFRARHGYSRASVNHEFSFVHDTIKRPFDSNQSINYIVCDQPLAPEDLRLRTSGTRDPNAFVRHGSSGFMRLQQVVENYFSTPIAEFARILDWGCGCGRYFRYFTGNFAKPDVTGVDVDSRGIDWCRQAFPQHKFLTIETKPPIPLPDESFDLIYGISVMTHLREPDHLLWLEELSRLTRPKGVVLLTTMGDTAFWRGKLPWKLFYQWRFEHSGFLDTGANPDLDDLKLEADYYRNILISPEYIARNWTRYFDLIDILPGAMTNTQDLVILQKR